MDKENKVMKKDILPNEHIPSLEYDLFKDLLTNQNDEGSVGNSLEFWDNIPKFFLTPNAQKELRTPSGHANPFEYEYTSNLKNSQKKNYKIVIQPAQIKQEDGKFKSFFPYIAEQNIEEILKKIFVTQSFGFHDVQENFSWVKFSLSMIKRELKEMKCQRNYSQIKHSLEIMSLCIITLYEGNEKIYSESLLSSYVGVTRKEYLEDTSAMHSVRLSTFVSYAVNNGKYRQFNLSYYMGLKNGISRFLYKKFVERFTYASLTTEYNFSYEDIKKNSGHLLKDDKKNRRIIVAALELFVKSGVLYKYKIRAEQKHNKIIGVTYIVVAADEFIRNQKTANKRNLLRNEIAEKNQLSFLQ